MDHEGPDAMAKLTKRERKSHAAATLLDNEDRRSLRTVSKGSVASAISLNRLKLGAAFGPRNLGLIGWRYRSQSPEDRRSLRTPDPFYIQYFQRAKTVVKENNVNRH